MVDRPYAVLSCAISLDGYLDDTSGSRLVLSNAADLDRVDALRAVSDAILVGAGTVRSDNPRLVIHSAERREHRVALGRGPTPHKVTVTRSGGLDPGAPFFTTGACDKFVFCASEAAGRERERLSDKATVVDAGPRPDLCDVVTELGQRGVDRLLVEGGESVHTQFLAAGLADELQVVVAPFFVADSRAHRLVEDGPVPWNRSRRAELVGVQQIGDVVLLRYALSDRFVEAFGSRS